MFKNGVRIATLSLLAIYVNPAILAGPLHRMGGIPFFLVALVLVVGLVWVLRRTEKV
jgi:exosortase/archaeosortase family protein